MLNGIDMAVDADGLGADPTRSRHIVLSLKRQRGQ